MIARMEEMPWAVEEWRSRGRFVEVNGRNVFVVEAGEGPAPAVLILHGFPGSSFDWRLVVPEVARHAPVVAFDLLGHGLSDKPFEARYSLFEQADLAESVAAEAEADRCILVAHDMGNSVAAELLRRSGEGRLAFAIERVVLTNGSIFMGLAQLTPVQTLLLAMPDEPLPRSLPMEPFIPGLEATFSPEHRPSPDELQALVWLVAHNDGDRLLPRLIRYVEERRHHEDRWTAGLVEFSGPITAIWGEQDPIAVVDMAWRLKELRPQTEVLTWPDVGHWPCIEVPGRLAQGIVDRIGA
jgi:pimeloyl-ACP methyl ester carboxylesterase